MLALLAPAQAFASCEQLLSVDSDYLEFTYVGVARSDDEDPTPEEKAEDYRSLAHALAVAQRAFGLARQHVPEEGPARVVLLAHGRLAPEDLEHPVAVAVCRDAAGVDMDSSCVLWTIEIGRFPTEESARIEVENRAASLYDGNKYLEHTDVPITYETCIEKSIPGPFAVKAGRGWSVRYRLYFTREDAERAARALGPGARVLKQRVDGPLLERAMEVPMGC